MAMRIPRVRAVLGISGMPPLSLRSMNFARPVLSGPLGDALLVLPQAPAGVVRGDGFASRSQARRFEMYSIVDGRTGSVDPLAQHRDGFDGTSVNEQRIHVDAAGSGGGLGLHARVGAPLCCHRGPGPIAIAQVQRQASATRSSPGNDNGPNGHSRVVESNGEVRADEIFIVDIDRVDVSDGADDHHIRVALFDHSEGTSVQGLAQGCGELSGCSDRNRLSRPGREGMVWFGMPGRQSHKLRSGRRTLRR